MFTLKNNPLGVRHLVEKFGGTRLQIAQEFFAWFPPVGTKLELVEVEVASDRRVERWKLNDEELVIERLDTYDEIYKPISW